MERSKLGLALAGGGFRASLFHVGVLRRMAEMDLLRYVEVLSTVSGGSVVGALYLLLLKERLEDPARAGQRPEQLALSRDDYRAIVNDLQHTLVEGVQHNLRTRLLMNPLVLLRVMLFGGTLGGAMARLYEHHFFAGVVTRLRERDRLARAAAAPGAAAAVDAAPHRTGCISIRAMRLRQEAVRTAGGSEDYNHRALDPQFDVQRGGPGSAVTRLVINTTSLNSGARFWFSHAEIGDWYLGHIRHEEIASELLPRKVLLELSPDAAQALEQQLGAAAALGEAQRRRAWQAVAARVLDDWAGGRDAAAPQDLPLPAHHTRLLARWWVGGRHGVPIDPSGSDTAWHGLATLAGLGFGNFVAQLAGAEAGRLREAKAFAWYLQIGRARVPRVSAGLDDEALVQGFWDALRSIDPVGGETLQRHLGSASRAPAAPARSGLWTLVIEMFNLRMAEMMSPRVQEEWDRFPLSHAVAASAAFPPVFPPFLVRELYDDLKVRNLGLTDGGVFDNLGTTALLDEQCNYIVASDPGALFDTRQKRSSVGRLGLTGRLSEILAERPISLYRHELNERRRLDQALREGGGPLPDALAQFVGRRALRGLALFRIDSDRLEPDPPPPPYRASVARLRTDLDAFGDLEVKALINEGYVLADQYLRAHLNNSPFGPQQRPTLRAHWQPVTRASQLPLPIHSDDERVARVLEAGQSRFLKALRLRAGWSVAATLLGLFALVHAVWWLDRAALVARLQGPARMAADWLGNGPVSFVPPLLFVQALERVPLRWWALGALVAAMAWIFARDALARQWQRLEGHRRERRTGWRRMATLLKKLRYATGWLVLLVVPVVVVAVPLGAVLAHSLFTLPFLRQARDVERLPGR